MPQESDHDARNRQSSDRQLIGRFVASQDQDALSEIVRRYLGLVHAAARRQVRDPHLASDITQAVFIVLVRKAKSLRQDTVLPAWLFAVTRHAVLNARRIRNRQQVNLSRVSQMTRDDFAAPADVPVELADEIRVVLDDGVAKLPSIERASILMHFFGGKSHKEVGESLGLSEEAARKRLSRGLERLRVMLGTRGAISESAIASVLVAERIGAAQFAEPTLVHSTANIATLANSTAMGPATAPALAPARTALAIARGVTRGLLRSKIRTALATVGIVLLAIAVTTLIAMNRSRPHATMTFGGTSANTSGTVMPSLAPLTLTLADGTTVQFLGSSVYPPAENSWLAADGSRIDCPDSRLLDVAMATAVPANFEAALRVTKPVGDVVRLRALNTSAGASDSIADGNSRIVVCIFTQDGSSHTAQLALDLIGSRWTMLAANEHPKQAMRAGKYSFDPITSDNGQARVTVRHPPIDGSNQVIAIDAAGESHTPIHVSATFLREVATTCTFDIPPEQIEKLLFQTRSVTQTVEVNDVSLSSDLKTLPTMIVHR